MISGIVLFGFVATVIRRFQNIAPTLKLPITIPVAILLFYETCEYKQWKSGGKPNPTNEDGIIKLQNVNMIKLKSIHITNGTIKYATAQNLTKFTYPTRNAILMEKNKHSMTGITININHIEFVVEFISTGAP